MPTSNDCSWLAFDIGYKQHTWASMTGGHHASGCLPNDPTGLRAFLKARTAQATHWRMLVEATGVYYLDVAVIAHELGIEVMVINPRMAHHFAEALGRRNKTDKLDADMLLQCLQRMPFQVWQPPRETWSELRSYGRFLVQLTEDGTAMRNRLHALSSTRRSPAFLRTELKRMIASNDRRIERIRAQAIALVQADSYLKARFDVFTTITGVADTSALSILSELITLPPTLSSRACTCHAGLDPRVFESGSSVLKAPRISRHGNKYLRRALFHPALSAGCHDPLAKGFKDTLVVDRGKKKMQANVAIMRKLLTACWAMMKDPQPYDASRLYHTTQNA